MKDGKTSIRLIMSLQNINAIRPLQNMVVKFNGFKIIIIFHFNLTVNNDWMNVQFGFSFQSNG